MMASQPPYKKQKVDQKTKLFDNLNVFVLEQGLGKTRQKIFTDQLKKHGAKVSASFNKELVQYLIVSKDLKLERILKLLKCKELPESVIIVSVDWISASLVSGNLENLDQYQLFTDRNKNLESKIICADYDSSKSRVSTETATTMSLTSSTKTSNTSTITTTKTTSFQQLITLKRQIEMLSDSSSCSENEDEEKKIHEIKKGDTKNLPVRAKLSFLFYDNL